MAKLREAQTWISVCDLMKVTRLRFKYALRQCQAMEEAAYADAFAHILITQRHDGFLEVYYEYK